MILLFALLALAASVPAPAAGQAQEPPKEKDKGKGKESEKDPTKPQEFEWPSNIGGKGLKDWLKEATKNPDPAIREFALKTLPNFGPNARKECSKDLLVRMSAERDPGVRVNVFNTVGVLGLEPTELTDGIGVLARFVDEGLDGGLTRLAPFRPWQCLVPRPRRPSFN